MTTQQPEALKLAFECEESAFHWANEIDTRAKAAKLLRAQHEQIVELKAALVKESARTASEKRRADQMSQQHYTQAALNSEARNELAQARARILELEEQLAHMADIKDMADAAQAGAQGLDAQDAARWRSVRSGLSFGDRMLYIYTMKHGFGRRLTNEEADTTVDAAIAAQAKQGGA